jgi:plastocyanin
MKRFVLFAVLSAPLIVLTAPQDARAGGGTSRVVVYATPVVYNMPAYKPNAARLVVVVGAVNRVGFVPRTITVAPGTTVRWVSRGREVHTVTSRNELFNHELPPGGTFSYTFMRPGTYRYYCRPHERMGMVGTVVVGSAGNGNDAH